MSDYQLGRLAIQAGEYSPQKWFSRMRESANDQAFLREAAKNPYSLFRDEEITRKLNKEVSYRNLYK